MFRTRRNTKYISLLFIFFLSVWQAGAFHHLLVTSHTISSESMESATSTAVRPLPHSARHAAAGDREEQNPEPVHQDSCQYLTSITLARFFVSPVVDSHSIVRMAVVNSVSESAQMELPPRPVLEYAPATSPPVAI